MRIFISWSGERSRLIGELLDNWLQCVLQAIDPWMSSKDIDRGSLWFTEINDQLKETSIGIICLTNDNKDKPWILFEAGALAKGLNSSRVCTFLIDIQPSDLEDPLAQFNHTFPTRDSIWSLVRTLNNALGEKALKEKVLERVFDTYWPQFTDEFTRIIEESPQVEKLPKRKNDDLLAEILNLTRILEKRMRNIELSNDLDKQESIYDRRFINPGSLDFPDKLIMEKFYARVPHELIIKELSSLGIPRSYVIHKIRKLELLKEPIQNKPDNDSDKNEISKIG